MEEAWIGFPKLNASTVGQWRAKGEQDALLRDRNELPPLKLGRLVVGEDLGQNPMTDEFPD